MNSRFAPWIAQDRIMVKKCIVIPYKHRALRNTLKRRRNALLCSFHLAFYKSSSLSLHSSFLISPKSLSNSAIQLSVFFSTSQLSLLIVFILFLFIYRCYNMLYLMIFLIFLVHFFRTTHWGLTFPGDKPVPGVSSGIECPLNDMLRYALNDRTTLEMTFFWVPSFRPSETRGEIP